MMPHPPTSPLFPYTTLFRSERLRERDAKRDPVRDRIGPLRLPDLSGPPGELHGGRSGGAHPDHPGGRSEEHTSNSSHRCISYAVFCLKKKKNKQTDNM